MLYNYIYYLLNSKDTLDFLQVMPCNVICINIVRQVVEVEVSSQAGLSLANCVNEMLSLKELVKPPLLSVLPFEILHDQLPNYVFRCTFHPVTLQTTVVSLIYPFSQAHTFIFLPPTFVFTISPVWNTMPHIQLFEVLPEYLNLV